MTSLPDPLPQNLKILFCSYNNLVELPDLPKTLQGFSYANNNELFYTNYPDIDNYNGIALVDYVNKCNVDREKTRIQARTHIINTTQPFLEHYMRRAMHPTKIAQLLQDPEADIDECIKAYIDTL